MAALGLMVKAIIGGIWSFLQPLIPYLLLMALGAAAAEGFERVAPWGMARKAAAAAALAHVNAVNWALEKNWGEGWERADAACEVARAQTRNAESTAISAGETDARANRDGAFAEGFAAGRYSCPQPKGPPHATTGVSVGGIGSAGVHGIPGVRPGGLPDGKGPDFTAVWSGRAGQPQTPVPR